ncbi:hypothetical protein, conserved [Eimeria maxima]|uniref:DNA/RNA-binding protein Alba-like domain-containing protein n=1 Tax=Eimeria maxima TaxID=5804 RepID=U6MDU8_EIMMA|nr:hypothetical protein, conserved [Eimeria maxima]CDJ60609.1 hypothetical protein, conserved [Eimeria maxima]
MAVIRGTGSCIKTAVFLAQDVVASFGGQVVLTCSTTEARQTPDSAAAANPTAAAASGGAAGAATEGGRAAEREETSTAKAVKQKGEAAFVAAASKLAAALGSSSGAAVLSLAAEPSSAQAYDEVVSLGKKHCSEDEEALEAAGIDQELSSFVRQRNISAIKIELRRLSLQ